MSHFSSKRATAASLGAVLSLTTDDLNVVVPDGAGNIDLNGAHGINTTGAVANQAVVQIDNTITLGDLSVVLSGADSLTITSGDITLSGTGAGAGGNINMPNTGGTVAGDIGVINWGGSRFIHNSGTQNTYVGETAGSLSGGSNLSVGIGYNALLLATTTANTAVGAQALSSKTATGGFNVAIGTNALLNATTGGNQTVIGHAACQDMTTGSNNCVMGTNAMTEATSASRNLALGSGGDAGGALEKGPLFKLDTGVNNIAIGCATSADLTGPGFNYTGAESNNILIGGATVGTLGESNVMRLGTSGAGEGQVNKAFIGGVDGVDIGSVAKVLTMASSQVGTATITAGANITVTPGANTITIASTASGGLTWSVETGATKAMAVNEGYFSDRTGATLAFTLPATAAVGDTMEIAQMEAGQLWTLAQNAGQTCYIGTSSTTTGVGGSLAATADGDWIELVCRVANTDFQVNVKSGNITVV